MADRCLRYPYSSSFMCSLTKFLQKFGYWGIKSITCSKQSSSFWEIFQHFLLQLTSFHDRWIVGPLIMILLQFCIQERQEYLFFSCFNTCCRNFLIVKASKMLGYIVRFGKEFRDPYILKMFYNSSFFRSHLDNANVVWKPYYGVHLKRIEAIQKKFLGFTKFYKYSHGAINWSKTRLERCNMIIMTVDL
jgi:hypothetical protein